jgi:ubiquinone/menaquinone biosynthesis C-methylase UbiE
MALYPKQFFDEFGEKQRAREQGAAASGETGFFRLCVKAPIDTRLKTLCSTLDSGDHILELGSGTGYWTRRILEYSRAKVVSADLSFPCLLAAKESAPELPPLLQADGEALPLPDEAVQAVVVIMVLHHVLDPGRILGELSRVTSRNGQLLLIDMTSDNPLIELGRRMFPLMPSRVKQAFAEGDYVVGSRIPEKYPVDPGWVVAFLEGHGFEIEQIQYAHLFAFASDWISRVLKLPFPDRFLSWLFQLEKSLLRSRICRKYAANFFIRAQKTNCAD